MKYASQDYLKEKGYSQAHIEGYLYYQREDVQNGNPYHLVEGKEQEKEDWARGYLHAESDDVFYHISKGI